MPRVAWLYAAPVKGLGLQILETARLTRDGVPGDRGFHLVDAKDRMVNGKRRGRLVQIAAVWDEAAGRLALTLPDGARVEGDVVLGEAVASNFFGGLRPGRVVRGPWAAALSDHAGEPLRLVRLGEAGTGVDRAHGGAVSLLSVASLHGLDPRRFRMTLGVDGTDAHAEDAWVGRELAVGGAVVRVTGHTGRCLVTSQDPDTGVADRDTLEELRRTRPVGTTEPLALGVHGVVVSPGLVRLGDALEVLA